MDEENYRSVRDDLAPITCAFEKSILALRVRCSKSNKSNIAEREVVHCVSYEYQMECKKWLQILRSKSQFSLHLTNIDVVEDALPHTKEMKVQVGGISGLICLLEETDIPADAQVGEKPDVFLILKTCRERLGDYESLPFDQIVKSVVSFHFRKG